jgi:hypothetical protein
MAKVPRELKVCVRVAVEVRWSAAGWDGSPLTSIVVAVDALFVNNTASLMLFWWRGVQYDPSRDERVSEREQRGALAVEDVGGRVLSRG